MKRLNNEGKPFRCGDVDPQTGLVFRCYFLQRINKAGYYTEQWLRPDVFAAIKEKMKQRARQRRLPTG